MIYYRCVFINEAHLLSYFYMFIFFSIDKFSKKIYNVIDIIKNND